LIPEKQTNLQKSNATISAQKEEKTFCRERFNLRFQNFFLSDENPVTPMADVSEIYVMLLINLLVKHCYPNSSEFSVINMYNEVSDI